MLFQWFWKAFCNSGPKFFHFTFVFIRFFDSIFDLSEKSTLHWFYKVPSLFENVMRNPSLANAFSMIMEAILRFGLKFFHFTSVFIRLSDSIFGLLKKLFFYWFYKVFPLCENAMRNPSLANAFSMFSVAFFDFGCQKAPFFIGFIRYFACEFPIAQNLV